MIERGIFSAFLILFLLGALPASAQTLPAELVRYADFVFYNGPILTVDTDQGDFTVAQAVAIRDGKILAVGTRDRVLGLAGPETTRFDLNGRALIPGVINTHVHPNRFAVRNFGQHLLRSYREQVGSGSISEWTTKEAVQRQIQRIVNQAGPNVQWITIGGGTRQQVQLLRGFETSSREISELALELTLSDLDPVAPDTPLAISVRPWLGIGNSKAIDLLIDTYGEDLPGIERDNQGRPTGRLIGFPVQLIAEEMLPQFTAQELAPVYRKQLLADLAPLGQTTFSSRLKANETRAFMQLDTEGQMPVRLAYGHQIGRFNPFFERDLRRSMEVPLGFGSDKIWLAGISVELPDGNPGTSDVCTTYPKVRQRVGDSFPEGKCYWDLPESNTREVIRILAEEGYRVSNVHSFGDKGLEIAVDIFEKVGAAGRRFALDHSQLFNPRVIAKSGELGMYWSLSTGHFAGPRGELAAYTFGDEVVDRMLSPVRELLDAGARVTYEADEIGEGLEVLVTRRVVSGVVRGLRNAVDRQTALRIMTRWGAEYVLREDQLGSIEPGKFADLVVLDRNPLDPALPDDQLSELQVLLTLVGGEVIYDRERDGVRDPRIRGYGE